MDIYKHPTFDMACAALSGSLSDFSPPRGRVFLAKIETCLIASGMARVAEFGNRERRRRGDGS